MANELLAETLRRHYDKKTEAGPHARSWWAGGMLAPFCGTESAKRKFADLVRRLRHGGPTNERDKQGVIGCSFIKRRRGDLIASDGLPPITNWLVEKV